MFMGCDDDVNDIDALDITDEKAVLDYLEKYKPQCVINCTGFTHFLPRN